MSEVISESRLPGDFNFQSIIDFIDDKIERGMYEAQTIRTETGREVRLEERACFMVEPDMRIELNLFLDKLALAYAKSEFSSTPTSRTIPVSSKFLCNPVGGGVPLHSDFVDGDRMPIYIITLAYFNSDFEGGELVFPDLEKTFKPKPGLVLVFDAKMSHLVTPLTSGRRYCLQRGHTWMAT